MFIFVFSYQTLVLHTFIFMASYQEIKENEPLIEHACEEPPETSIELSHTRNGIVLWILWLLGKTKLKRNLIGFWIIGLCNNFSYVVMLSAAFDILKEQRGEKTKSDKGSGFVCHLTSTGVVLLADILPTLVIKLTAPFYMQKVSYHIRVVAVVLFSYASLLTVAFSPNVGVSLLGVVFASISSGAGEITFLSITSHFKTTTISAWSSGTGMAGVAGALSYAGLTQAGLSEQNTLLVLMIVPTVLVISFWGILEFPEELKLKLICCKSKQKHLLNGVAPSSKIVATNAQDITRHMKFKEKVTLVKPLIIYMVPLFLVYFAEYTINQALFELLYYKVLWLNQAEQYRWFQVDYQVGVFISRSSTVFIRINKLYIPVIVQWCILIFCLLEVAYTFVPNIWITLAVILLEGLCGGSVYVNAFYLISENVPEEVREFSLGVASVADSCGIVLSGFVSTPIHNALCHLKLK